MELDLVDAVAVAVVGAQDRRVLVGLHAPVHRLPAPGGPDGADALDVGAAALALQGFDERAVVGEEVAAGQRRGLVGDGVGGHGVGP